MDASRSAPIFDEFCRPWLDRAAERLPIWDKHPELADALAAQLSEIAARTIVRELKRCREAGLLQGATPTARWQDFSKCVLVSSEMQNHLRMQYPLLVPLLDKITDYFCSNLEKALMRLRLHSEDAHRTISCIETDLSDPHAEGRTVICFTFTDGKKLIYKPRSVRGEAWWTDFVVWWNASGVSESLQLRAPMVSDHGDYGWCEFIESQPEKADSSRYFYRLGAHAAITWMFGIGDCHFGNFVASEAGPVLVDAECVGSFFWYSNLPKVPANLPWVFTPVWKTPLVGGLFPPWIMPRVAGQPLYLAPGIGGTEDRPMPVKRPVWRGAGTDELRMELSAGLMPSVCGRSGTRDSPIEIAEGFRVAARHLLEHRDEILAWLESESSRDFLRIRPRILLRNTTVYQQILEAASGPKYLETSESRRSALHTISQMPVIGGEDPNGLVPAEVSFLDAQIYPRFVVNPKGTSIVSDDETCDILKCDLKVSAERARRHWVDLSKEKIDWHAKILSAACRQASELQIHIPEGEARYLRAAIKIGEALERQVIRTDEGASWLGLTSDAQGNVSYEMPGGDFASGSAGCAAFLALLGEACKDRRWIDLAIDAMRFSDHYWTRCFEFEGAVPWSAYYGAASLLFAASKSCTLRRHPSIVAMLSRWLDVAEHDRSWLKMNGDHLAGLPGWTLALAGISSEFALAKDLLRHAFSRLLDREILDGLTSPGIAHGIAGWVTAVIAAARALEDNAAMHVAQETIMSFPEQWAQFELRSSVQKSPPGGWCNGAIGLMAVAAELPATRDCAYTFLEKARLWFAHGYGGHHFCCGEAGRALLLANTAELLSDPLLSAEAQRCADAIIEHANKHGFLTLQGIPERLTIPGWLNGISGVGAALLAVHRSPVG